jgi:hypothetical protein
MLYQQVRFHPTFDFVAAEQALGADSPVSGLYS